MSTKVPKTGLLYKRGHVRRNWRRRFFTLVGGSDLRYYDKEGGAEKGRIDLTDDNVLVRLPASKRRSDPTQFQFEICHGATSLLVAADDAATMNDWVQAVNQAVWAASIQEMGDTPRSVPKIQHKISEGHRLVKDTDADRFSDVPVKDSMASEAPVGKPRVSSSGKVPPPVPPRPSTLSISDDMPPRVNVTGPSLESIGTEDVEFAGEAASSADACADGWRQLTDGDGQPYWYNDKTGEHSTTSPNRVAQQMPEGIFDAKWDKASGQYVYGDGKDASSGGDGDTGGHDGTNANGNENNRVAASPTKERRMKRKSVMDLLAQAVPDGSMAFDADKDSNNASTSNTSNTGSPAPSPSPDKLSVTVAAAGAGTGVCSDEGGSGNRCGGEQIEIEEPGMFDNEESLLAERREVRSSTMCQMGASQLTALHVTTTQKLWRGRQVRRRLKQKFKMSKHRKKVVLEMLMTEKSYNASIGQLVDTAIVPLKWQCKHSKNQVMSMVELDSIFSNMEQIYDLSSQLIEKLEPVCEGWHPYALVGDILLFIAPFLQLYSIFCNRFEQARADLDDAQKKPLFKAWREKCYDPLGIPTMGSLLIQPVQRIPRYVLLLRELIKSTWPEHPDHDNLTRALGLMEKQAVAVNASFNSADASAEMVEAQAQFGAFVDILAPSRRFVRRAEMVVQKSYAEEKVWVWVFNDLLVIADKIGESAYEYDGHVPLTMTPNKRNGGGGKKGDGGGGGFGRGRGGDGLHQDGGITMGTLVHALPDLKFTKHMVRVSCRDACYVFVCGTRQEKALLLVELTNAVAQNSGEGASVTGGSPKNAHSSGSKAGSGKGSHQQHFPLLHHHSKKSGKASRSTAETVGSRYDAGSMTVVPVPRAEVKSTVSRHDHNDRQYTAYVIELTHEDVNSGTSTTSSGSTSSGSTSSSSSSSSTTTTTTTTTAHAHTDRLFKRYSEFAELEAQLKDQYRAVMSDVHMTALPPKRLFSTSSREIEKRMVVLGSFLQHVLMVPELAHSHLVREFLEHHGYATGAGAGAGANGNGNEATPALLAGQSSWDSQQSGRGSDLLLTGIGEEVGDDDDDDSGDDEGGDRGDAGGSANAPGRLPRIRSSPHQLLAEKSAVLNAAATKKRQRWSALPSSRSARGKGVGGSHSPIGRMQSSPVNSAAGGGGGGGVVRVGMAGSRMSVIAGRQGVMLPAEETVDVHLCYGEPVPLPLNTMMRTPDVLGALGRSLGLPDFLLSTFGLYLCAGAGVDAGRPPSARGGGHGHGHGGDAAFAAAFAQVSGVVAHSREDLHYALASGRSPNAPPPSHCLDAAEFPLRALQQRRIRDPRAKLLIQRRLVLGADRVWMAGGGGAAGTVGSATSSSSSSGGDGGGGGGSGGGGGGGGGGAAAMARLMQLQCYRNVMQGAWRVALPDATMFAALHAQAAVGDYDGKIKLTLFEDGHEWVPPQYKSGMGRGNTLHPGADIPSLAGSVDLQFYSLVRDPHYKDKAHVFQLVSPDNSLEWRHDYLLGADNGEDYKEWAEAISTHVAAEGKGRHAQEVLHKLKQREEEAAHRAQGGGGAHHKGSGRGGQAQQGQDAAAKRAKTALDLITGNRMPQKQGWLNKKGHKRRNWNKRWFVLVDKQLLYFKTRPHLMVDQAHLRRELRIKWEGLRGLTRTDAERRYALFAAERCAGYGVTYYTAQYDTQSGAGPDGASAGSSSSGGGSVGCGSSGGGGGGSTRAEAGAGGRSPDSIRHFVKYPQNVVLAISEKRVAIYDANALSSPSAAVGMGSSGSSSGSGSISVSGGGGGGGGGGVSRAGDEFAYARVGVFEYDQLDQVDDFYGEVHLAAKGQVLANASQSRRNLLSGGMSGGGSGGGGGGGGGGMDGGGGESIFKTGDAHEIVRLIKDYMVLGKKSDAVLDSALKEQQFGQYRGSLSAPPGTGRKSSSRKVSLGSMLRKLSGIGSIGSAPIRDI